MRRVAPLRRPSTICCLTSSRSRISPLWVFESRQKMQWSLQAKVSLTQLRFSCAASS
jgi:hypothetical protein